MKKFIVVEEPSGNRTGDIFTQLFDTAEEATQGAKDTWYHLTDSEQKKTHVYSAVILDKDCETDDDGNVDWGCYSDSDNYPDSFDSNIWYAVIYDEDYAWDDGSYIFSEAVEKAKEINFTGTNSGQLEISKIDIEHNFCDDNWCFNQDDEV